ncbi:hypothetical protein B0G83_10427 [Paraburkholderia sp. BL21I4N1]|nr:hypothetical protein B0G83_10427 [Paraburkholderia sp. BL21I4N1]
MILRCFALRGNPSREIAGVAQGPSLPIIAELSGHFCPPDPTCSGGTMDLAMAMGVALFGMFAASTVYFFYKIER